MSLLCCVTQLISIHDNRAFFEGTYKTTIRNKKKLGPFEKSSKHQKKANCCFTYDDFCHKNWAERKNSPITTVFFMSRTKGGRVVLNTQNYFQIWEFYKNADLNMNFAFKPPVCVFLIIQPPLPAMHKIKCVRIVVVV